MNDVVKFRQDGHVGIIALEEREFKNTFSKRFIEGVTEAFQQANKIPDLKVIVVHGFENYFCCGGTKEELIGIFEGTLKFNDLDFFSLPLRCEIPVISAMQGHALGGGLAFGSYADMIVLGRECLYSANFMKYGFTPGMGANYIIPKKFGALLGTEMLLSAKNYSGEELRERGVPMKVVKRDDVIEVALKLASELADKPLLSLKVLKRYLTREIVATLPQVIEDELAMHKTTFAQPEVRKRIEELFGR
jgi:polyketide biosynthesis enoyl-CoA hydratase PksI